VAEAEVEGMLAARRDKSGAEPDGMIWLQ
jgi:hypothetical protein